MNDYDENQIKKINRKIKKSFLSNFFSKNRRKDQQNLFTATWRKAEHSKKTALRELVRQKNKRTIVQKKTVVCKTKQKKQPSQNCQSNFYTNFKKIILFQTLRQYAVS